MFDTFDRTGNAEFPFPKAVVFRALSVAVQNIRGMEVESKDAMACRIELKTGISAFSWGERVSISVGSSGDDSSVVSIGSGAKTIFGSATTHGKNRQNVREILEQTSRVLQKSGALWRAELAPPSPVSPPAAAQLPKSLADEIVKLVVLRDRGVLTAEEFDALKQRLVSGT
jgi:hypothetical protein